MIPTTFFTACVTVLTIFFHEEAQDRFSWLLIVGGITIFVDTICWLTGNTSLGAIAQTYTRFITSAYQTNAVATFPLRYVPMLVQYFIGFAWIIACVIWGHMRLAAICSANDLQLPVAPGYIVANVTAAAIGAFWFSVYLQHMPRPYTFSRIGSIFFTAVVAVVVTILVVVATDDLIFLTTSFIHALGALKDESRKTDGGA